MIIDRFCVGNVDSDSHIQQRRSDNPDHESISLLETVYWFIYATGIVIDFRSSNVIVGNCTEYTTDPDVVAQIGIHTSKLYILSKTRG